MAYSGYLLKIGNYTVPHKFIRADTYSPYDNMQDIDDYTDANGELHRNAVDLKAIKVEFETPAMLTNKDLTEFLNNIKANFIDAKSRSVMITAYIPFEDDYVTQKGYMVDITPKMYGIFNDVIKYNPIRFAFVGGVANDWL